MNKKKFSHYKTREIKKEISILKNTDSKFIESQGEKMALSLFNFSSQNVPAYSDFLERNKVSKVIKDIDDFKYVPVVRKDNYLRKFSYERLFPQRSLENATTISATSGSTGESFYFPRSEVHDAYYEYATEIFFINQFGLSKKTSTLCVLGFGLGIWIGGIFTYKNLNKLAQKGYKLTIVPVGTNKDSFPETDGKFFVVFTDISSQKEIDTLRKIFTNEPLVIGVTEEKNQTNKLELVEKNDKNEKKKKY
jgi:phenylacetate-CoA ligase